MTTVLHARPHTRFTVIKNNLRRKELHGKDYGSNFIGGSFRNRENVRAPIHFRREIQPQHLKRWFFSLKNRPIHFHINNTSVIRLVKKKQVEFFQQWNQITLIAQNGTANMTLIMFRLFFSKEIFNRTVSHHHFKSLFLNFLATKGS